MANEDKSTRYQRSRRRAAAWTVVIDLIVLVGALAAAARGAFDASSAVFFVVTLCAVRFLAVLPLSYRTEIVLERQYQRAQAPVGPWAAGFGRRAALATVAATSAALAVQEAARWAGQHWWALVAGTFAAVVAAVAYLMPTVLARLASDVVPLRRQALEERLSALAARVGIPAVDVFEWKVDGRGARVSAMLVGVGRDRRILVADAVLDSHTDEEVEVIVAHELAHYVRGDTWRSSLLAVVTAAVGLYVSARAVDVLGPVVGIRGPADLAALPLIALVCRGVLSAATPAVNAVSRAQERRADRDALAWTRNAPALVRTLRRLSAAHLTEDRPSRLAEVFFGRHPSVTDRIAAAEEWGRGNR